MLCVTYHCNRYVTYQDTALNGVFLVVVKRYKLLPYAVRLTPSVYNKIRMKPAAFNKSTILIYLCLGLLVTLWIYDYCKSRFALIA